MSAPAAASAVLIWTASFCVHAASPAPCAQIDSARIEGVRRPMPDPAACATRLGIAGPSGSAVGDIAIEALFAYEKSRLAAGRFDDAEKALDCVEAVLGDRGDANTQYELVLPRVDSRLSSSGESYGLSHWTVDYP
jgi:hypothetical protein